MSDLEFTPEQLAAATEEELEAILKVKKALKALESPLDYACYVTPQMKRFAFVEYLNNVLTALVEHRLYKSGPGPVSVRVFKSREDNNGREDKKGRLVHPITGEPVIFNLGINMPPQHGKSMLVSEHFVPWFATKFPDESLIHIAYAGHYSQKYGRLGRRHILEHPELGLKLADDKQSVTDWGIDGHRGTVIFRGVNGAITGEGGNVLIDDPVSGDEEAVNPERMEKWFEAYNSNIRTRIHPEKIQILIQTRWSFNDPTGKFRETENEKWFWAVLPALAYDDVNEDGISIDVDNENRPDPLGRRPGDALCPERFDEEDLASRQAGMGPKFDPLYQARPSATDTGLFTSFHHYKLVNGVYQIYGEGETEIVAENACYRFATMDTAATTKKTSDYTVFMVFDLTPSRKLIVRHVERKRVKSSDHKKWTHKHANRWGVRWVGIETKTYGLTLYQKLVAEGKLQVRELKADTDKVSRALVASDMIANKQIFFSIDAEWRVPLERELQRFLKDVHDDQVDALAYGARQYTSLPSSWDRTEKPLMTPASEGQVARSRSRLVSRRSRRNEHPELGDW